jgi:flagellar basal-body rod protein FlgB
MSLFEPERRFEMISSGAFNYINVLETVADASWLRHSVISNNIANADTPTYKRKDVDFQTYLEEELSGGSSLDDEVADADLEVLTGRTYTDYSTVSYRLDGNNVDIDTENSYLAQNQIKYYTVLDSISQEFSRLSSVCKSGSGG